MIIIKQELIKPASPRTETIAVLTTIVFLVLFAGILLHFTNSKKYTKEVSASQISSITLNNEEISIFANLGIFAQEYKTLSESYKDLSPKVLDEELFYPPFTKDATWEDSGKHKWEFFTHDNFTYYVGISQNKNIAGDFALIIDKKTYKYTIRYSKDFKEYSKLEKDKHSLAHAINKLKEVIAYTGDDLMKESRWN